MSYIFWACVAFLQAVGQLFHMRYQQICVIVNLWLQGGVLVVSALAPFAVCLYRSVHPVLLGGSGIYALGFVTAFVMMLRHYRLPYKNAFDRCVSDLQWAAAMLGTTYQIVNIIIFIVLFLLVFFFNVFVGYVISRIP